jgi:8-oxo-dGTP pyrophosphatase MutT (NUDIX family)
MAVNLLEVVNEADEVIGLKPRSEIHALGLRHREVHVWLLTLQGEVVLQRRSPTKESYSNYLDATAGGHVEPGQTYLQAACMELLEETGLTVPPTALIELMKLDKNQVGSGIKNLVYRMIYILPWQGNLDDLVVEQEDGAGFVLMPLQEILALSPDASGDLIPGLLTNDYREIWQKIATYISTNRQ